MDTDALFEPATVLASRVRSGEYSATAVVEASLERIDTRDDELNAYITVTGESARERARAADRALERGEDVGPLHGVPVALKDLTAFVEGVRHTFGCRAFADNVADHTSVLVERLEDAGAIVLGKTNTPEFGHKPVTDNMLVGPTSNPFDPSRNAGGSSGGSAAAVADGMAALGQGGDAAGSVRVPAAFCGIYGLKPSFGRIPQPARPNAFQSHTPFVDKGVLTRTVDDAALMLEVMAGPHPRDPFSLPAADAPFTDAVEEPIDGLSVAYSPDLGTFPVSEAVRETIEAATAALEDAGASVDPVDIEFGHDLPELRGRTRKAMMQIFTAKLAERIREGRGVDFLGANRDDVPPGFVERIEKGREFSAVDTDELDAVRTDVFDAIQDVFDEYDLLATPTTSIPAIPNDSLDAVTVDGESVEPRSDWLLTWPFNLTGHPAASIPAGESDEGLPVGMQLVGPRFDERTVLAASAAYERVRPWQERYPGRSA